MSGEAARKVPEPRTVTVRKTQAELGVQICGGNMHGIFVERLEDDSPAKMADGLAPGDMIVEVRRGVAASRQEARRGDFLSRPSAFFPVICIFHIFAFKLGP